MGVKARYIYQHNYSQTRRDLLVEAYRKSPTVKDIIRDPRDRSTVVLVDQSGERHSQTLSLPSGQSVVPDPEDDDIGIRGAETALLGKEAQSRRRHPLHLARVHQSDLYRRHGPRCYQCPCYSRERDQRLAGRTSATAKGSAARLMVVVGEFEASPELAARYKAAKDAWAVQKAAEEAKREDRARTRTPPWGTSASRKVSRLRRVFSSWTANTSTRLHRRTPRRRRLHQRRVS